MGKKTRSESDFLSSAQVGKLLGLDDSMVRRYAAAGLIPAHQVGRAWVFLRRDVEAWTPPRKPGRPKQEKP